MATKTITGTGVVAASDYKYVRYVGKTKDGHAVQIEFPRAICLSNPDWGFAEKDDTVAELVFTAVYDDDELAAGNRTEPFSIELGDGLTAGTGEILLGVGKLEVGSSTSDAKSIGLTRGGGSFVDEREFRPINADGDPGMVEGRIVLEAAQPRLTINALQWLTKAADLYAGMAAE